MKKLWQIANYFNYLFKSKTRFKVHSPFVYDLIENVFRDKEQYKDFRKLDRVHRRYARRTDRIETTDYGVGAGNGEFTTRITTVGNLVRHRTHSRKQLEFLYRMSRHFKPSNILEKYPNSSFSKYASRPNWERFIEFCNIWKQVIFIVTLKNVVYCH